ncbi:MAG: DUF6544 family protein [Pseudomonadota bacterium]
MNALSLLALLVCVAALCAAFIVDFGARHWTRRIRLMNDRLEGGRHGIRSTDYPPAHFDSRELEFLPPVVQRFFRAALKEGQPMVAAATVDLIGDLNLSAKDEQWKLFSSQQRAITHRPGFLWDARVSMLPGVNVRVVDSYISGAGLMHASVLGLHTVGMVRGRGEIARGEFMRFFAEAVWYPTALLPSQGVRWEAVDEHSANATMVDGPLSVTLLFRFNCDDLVESVRTESRGCTVNDVTVMLPWECHLSCYEERHGMKVPGVGEAAWIHPEGRKSYFHGSVTSLSYEFVPL